MNVYLAAFCIYSVIGVGVSLLIANYQDDLLKVETPAAKKGVKSSLAELVFANVIVVLVWPLMIYASLTWWKKTEATSNDDF
jgi:hypothetical protein